MSLYTVAQAEPNFTFATNLDTSTTEKANKSSITVSSAQYGTVTQNASSLTGNASYDFGSDGRVLHQWGGGYGISNFIHEIVFKKSSVPSTDVDLFASLNDSQLAIQPDGKLMAYVYNGSQQRLYSLANLCDGKFHHVVISYMDGSTGFRLYVDGVLQGSTSSIGNLNYSAFVNLGSYSNTSGGNPLGYSQATIDFYAFYNGSGLTNAEVATFVSNHMATFADKTVTATPVTASALSVQPSISISSNITATALTASAASGDHYNSTRDGFTLLDTYMNTLTLEQYYVFDEPKAIKNYGTGGASAYSFTGTSKNDLGTGIQGHGALRITGGNTGGVYAVGTNTFSTEFTDDNFSMGFWVKKSTTESARIYTASTAGSENLTIQFESSGYLTAATNLQNQTRNITTNTSYTDGNWHYVAVTLSGGTLTLYVDNVSKGTATLNHSMSGFTTGGFGIGDTSVTEQMYVSDFYVATSANVGTTQIANIWTYGQPTVQGSAAMPMPIFSRDNALNQYVISKSPAFYFKMDEGTGAPQNIGSVEVDLSITGTNFTQNISSPNYKAFKSTDRDTQYSGSWSATSGTFSSANQQTILLYAKLNSGNQNALLATAAFGSITGNGLILQQLANGTIRFRISSATLNEDATTTATFADGNYHMFVAVKNGSSTKLYVDGIERASNSSSTITLTDSGVLAIGGLPNLPAAAASRDITIDEFAVLPTAFTAADAFEAYQKVAQIMDWTATSLSVDPTVSVGFGPTIAQGPMTASANMSVVFPPIAPMKSEALFLNPNYEATKNTSNAVTAWTASAQGENPGWNIGEINAAIHMDASASSPDARVLIPGKWNASPAVANPARMVEPALSTTLGARIVAQSMPVQGIFVTPPAYKLITDDIWYSKLYLQHSILHGEKGYTAGVSSAGAFLKLFDDVTTSLSGANTNKIINNLPRSIIVDDPRDTDTSTQYANSSNAFLTATPTPLLEVGTFDDYERKAVRFRNIQFEGTQDTYKGEGSYSLEFTFKSTKSNQVIAQGKTFSFYGYQSATSSIGLVDGKLFGSRVTQEIGGTRVFAHPDNTSLAKYGITTSYGNKRIDDGFWHHIIIQYGYDGRVQIWIDGQLDIQFLGGGNNNGGGLTLRPFILGSNNSNPRWQSDFETSAWSYDGAFFVLSDQITEHHTASIKYEPIHAEPMTATTEIGQDSTAAGNRGRALMLYFWPTDVAQGSQRYPGFTSTESSNELTTLDYFTRPPQEYEGWDVFPVDVTGYWVSDLVKKESYGKIGSTNFIKDVGPWQRTDQAPIALFNTSGTFRDPITDAARYIDLLNDIDLSKFDMIMFKNYPNDPNEKDSFSGSEVVDAYFNLRESKIFEDFVKSLRAAVDTGISLMVANAQLALDLKIVDRVEVVPDMDDNLPTDPYAPTQIPGQVLPTYPQYPQPVGWADTWKNNRTRIVNVHPDITDYPGLIRTQLAYWYPSDEIRWGEPERVFLKYEHKDSLQVGDEFVISSTGLDADKNRTGYFATPFENVKCGKILTAFANTVRRGLDLIDNPYKNYAQSIIIQPGDVLDGRQVGGKIYVNFTEEINKCTESAIVELTSDYWINYAYNNGSISLEERDEYLASPDNAHETPYWSVDGRNLLVQSGQQYEMDSNINKSGIQKDSVKVRKISKNGGLSFRSVASGSPFFSIELSWRYPMAGFEMPSMPTRGFRWLSNREYLVGTVIRPAALTASAQMPNATEIVDKVNNFKAQSMVATATIEETLFSSGTRTIIALPAIANATIVKPGSTIAAAPMISNASMFAESRPSVASEDQVVLYLIHVDPILYIREDVIK